MADATDIAVDQCIIYKRELNHIHPVMVINTAPELRTILLQKVLFHFNRFEKQMDTRKV